MFNEREAVVVAHCEEYRPCRLRLEKNWDDIGKFTAKDKLKEGFKRVFIPKVATQILPKIFEHFLIPMVCRSWRERYN
jgi:hypothetical protein